MRKFIKTSIVEFLCEEQISSKNISADLNKKAFQIFSWNREYLIAKVLYDNGIKTQDDFRDWLKTIDNIIPQPLCVAVENAFRDFDIKFINPKKIPNIFKLSK